MSRKEPAHIRVSDYLRELVESGDPGERVKLPTELDLVERHGVSRQTARRAYQDLQSEGLVERTPGRGTYSIPAEDGQRFLRTLGSVEDLMDFSRDTTMRILSPLKVVQDVRLAGGLGIESTDVVTAEVLRLHRRKVLCHTRLAFPTHIGEQLIRSDLPQIGPGTFIGVVDKITPGGIVGALQEISAVTCTENIASYLDVNPGTPILEVVRTYFDAERNFVEWALSSFNPLSYTYSVELRRGR